jgi:small-conductance mechanosensitive channel
MPDLPSLGFVPAWLVALAAAGVLAMLAVSLYGLLTRRLSAALQTREPFAASLLARTRPLVRLILTILIVVALLPAAELAPAAERAVERALLIGVVVALAWAALIACDIGSDIYLRRFDITAADNLLARKHVTQVRILKRIAKGVVVIVALAAVLMTFEGARQYGVSLLASAGAAGIVLGLAAQPVLTNLIAGIQLAITQPIRVDDAVVIEGEWGWIEEITGTYVVVKLWDWRRLIVPLGYFMQKPFQNWTRQTASIIGSVFVWVDYTVPVDRVRAKVEELARANPLWDGDVVNVQVTDSDRDAVQLRVLVSASTSPRAWDLRCELREKLVAFLQAEFPDALPRRRVALSSPDPG